MSVSDDHIVSRPLSQQGRDTWDRVFGKGDTKVELRTCIMCGRMLDEDEYTLHDIYCNSCLDKIERMNELRDEIERMNELRDEIGSGRYED